MGIRDDIVKKYQISPKTAWRALSDVVEIERIKEERKLKRHRELQKAHARTLPSDRDVLVGTSDKDYVYTKEALMQQEYFKISDRIDKLKEREEELHKKGYEKPWIEKKTEWVDPVYDALDPYVTPIATGLLLLYGGYQGVKSAKDYYNYIRLGKTVLKLSKPEKQKLVEEIIVANRAGGGIETYPKQYTEIPEALRGKYLKREPIEVIRTRPIFQKFERLFGRTKVAGTPDEPKGLLFAFGGGPPVRQVDKALGKIPPVKPEAIPAVVPGVIGKLPDFIRRVAHEQDLIYAGLTKKGEHRFIVPKTKRELVVGDEEMATRPKFAKAVREHYLSEGKNKQAREVRINAYPIKGGRVARKKQWVTPTVMKAHAEKEAEFEKYRPEEIVAGHLKKGDKFKIRGEEYKVEVKEPGKIVIVDGDKHEVDEFAKIEIDRGEIAGIGKKLPTRKVVGAKHEQIVSPELLGQAKIPSPKMLNDLNPTGGVFVENKPEIRATAPLGENITTLDKTMGKSPDETITIYRGAPKTQKEIVPGDFVTTNKQLAQDYAGTGQAIEKEVKLSDVLDDKTEPLGEEYIYRPSQPPRAGTEGEVWQQTKGVTAQFAGYLGGDKSMPTYHIFGSDKYLEGDTVLREQVIDAGAKIVPGGKVLPGMVSAPPTKPKPSVFSEPEAKRFQKRFTQKAMPRIEHYIRERGGLPKDPQQRKEYLDDVELVFRKQKRFELKGVKKEIKGKRQPNVLNPYVSIRYAFSDMEERTGIPIHKPAMKVLNKTSMLDHAITKDFQEMFKTAGIHHRDISWHKDRQNAIKKWLFEEDTQKRQLYFKQLDEPSKKFATELHKELQGQTATVLRFIRWQQWNRHSPKLISELNKLKERPSTESTIKRIGVLEEQIRKLAKSVAPDGSVSELQKASGVYDQTGSIGLLKHLDTQTWGTRAHYYMSKSVNETDLENFVDFLMPGEKIEMPRPSPKIAMGVSEAQTRREKAIMREGALLPEIFSHIHRIKMVGLMAEDIDNLTKTFMQTDPTRRDINIFKRNVKNALGFAEPAVPIISKVTEVPNKIFWRAYPLAFGRAAWYTARNLHQNLALAPGQLSPVESAKAIYSIATKGFSEQFKLDFKKYFKSRISQKMPMHRHFMLLDKSQAMKETGSMGVQILDTFGQIIPISDEGNRVLAFPLAYKIAERNMGLYRKGKINFSQFLRRTRLTTLSVPQQLDLRDLIKQDKDAQVIFRLAEMKTENIHFKYRTAERAGVEQRRIARPIAGLYNWPRGLYEALYRGGVRPFVEGVKTKNFNKAYTGLMGLMFTVIGMYAAREAAKKVLGKKSKHGAYDITETLTGYELGSPGLKKVLELSKSFGQAIELSREGKVDSAVKLIGNQAAYYLPLVDDMVRIYEANNDRRGVTAMTLLRKGIKKNLGKRAKRTSVETWQHILFGTEEYPQSQEKKKHKYIETGPTPGVSVEDVPIEDIPIRDVIIKEYGDR